MGKPTGFKEYPRETAPTRKPEERLQDFQEIYLEFADEKAHSQAARCMDCGVPFCHNGCPLGNNIPDFNDAVYRGDWAEAIEVLSATNNFPEFTGRICPAPCEASCVLGINNDPVTIELIEKTVAEKAFELGLIQPRPPKLRTGKRVAVIGSGPAGLAAADQLNQAGHLVVVLERDDRIGGLLRYGIPDFKLEKHVLDRRLALMQEEGIVFQTHAHVGENVSAINLVANYDAVLLCGGSTIPRDLPIPGRELEGVHFAMDFLTQQNRQVSGLTVEVSLSAKDKHVVVIGGGDTGADCVGTSNRQGAASVTQIELLSKPPLERTADNPWPLWPMILRTSSSHEEGCERKWALLTEAFIGDEDGRVKALRIVEVEWARPASGGRSQMLKKEGTEREIPCDLALLAVGFVHPKKDGMLAQLGVELDVRGMVHTENHRTSVEKVFSAGDMRRGQSLVVWAISEGREAAREVDVYLMEDEK